MTRISCAVLAVALIGAGPAVADCGSHAAANNGGQALQTAQARDGTTLREEENRRSGGTGTGGSAAPAPGAVKPQGDSQGSSPQGTQTPQSGATGSGQNQGSPPGTSSGSGTSGAPSTSGGSGGSSGGSSGGGSGN